MDEVRWSPSLYPHLYTPTSSSWSLHWTYRDSQLVNLPVSLLVEGDVIALRPGQEAFASVRGIKVCSCLELNMNNINVLYAGGNKSSDFTPITTKHKMSLRCHLF